MIGTRNDWGNMLPTLQKFVAGETVQRLDYDGRWKDTDTMYSVLQGVNYRIKPTESIMGIWTCDFTMRDASSGSNGAVGKGTLRWEGANTDTPRWPSFNGLTRISPDHFTPNL